MKINVHFLLILTLLCFSTVALSIDIKGSVNKAPSVFGAPINFPSEPTIETEPNSTVLENDRPRFSFGSENPIQIEALSSAEVQSYLASLTIIDIPLVLPTLEEENPSPLCCSGEGNGICSTGKLPVKCDDVFNSPIGIGKTNEEAFGRLFTTLQANFRDPNDETGQTQFQQGRTKEFCRRCLPINEQQLKNSERALSEALSRELPSVLRRQHASFIALAPELFEDLKSSLVEHVKSEARSLEFINPIQLEEMSPMRREIILYARDKNRSNSEISSFIKDKLTCGEKDIKTQLEQLEESYPGECENAGANLLARSSEPNSHEINTEISVLDASEKTHDHGSEAHDASEESHAYERVGDIRFAQALSDNADEQKQLVESYCTTDAQNNHSSNKHTNLLYQVIFPGSNKLSEFNIYFQRLRINHYLADSPFLNMAKESPRFLCELVSALNQSGKGNEREIIESMVALPENQELSKKQSQDEFERYLQTAESNCGSRFNERSKLVLCGEFDISKVGLSETRLIDLIENTDKDEIRIAAQVKLCEARSSDGKPTQSFDEPNEGLTPNPIDLSNPWSDSGQWASGTSSDGRRSIAPASEAFERRRGSELANQSIENIVGGNELSSSTSSSSGSLGTTRSIASSISESGTNNNLITNVLNSLNSNNQSSQSSFNRTPAPVPREKVSELLRDEDNSDLRDRFNELASEVNEKSNSQIDAVEAVRSALSSQNAQLPQNSGIDSAERDRLQEEINRLRFDLNQRDAGEAREIAQKRYNDREEEFDRLTRIENQLNQLRNYRQSGETQKNLGLSGAGFGEGNSQGFGANGTRSFGAVDGATGDLRSSNSNSINSSLNPSFPTNISKLVQNKNSNLGFAFENNRLVIKAISDGANGGETLYPADLDNIEVNASGQLAAIVYMQERIPATSLSQSSREAIQEFFNSRKPEALMLAEVTTARDKAITRAPASTDETGVSYGDLTSRWNQLVEQAKSIYDSSN